MIRGAEMNWELFFQAIQAFGAIAAIASVIWAINVYIITSRNHDYQKIRDAVIALPHHCEQLNKQLSESLFAAIGTSISNELRPMFEGYTIDSFSKWLLSEDSSNFKAQAIYMGLQKCDGVKEIQVLIDRIEDSQRTISTSFPQLGRAIRALLFYVTKPANYCISTRNLNGNLKFSNDEENAGIRKAVKEAQATGSEELYFRQLAFYITAICAKPLTDKDLGQQTLDLSFEMIDVISKTLCVLSNSKMRKIAKKDMRQADKMQTMEQSMPESAKKHSVQIAMNILTQFKDYFTEDEWEKLIEHKAQIIQLMEYDTIGDFYR